MSILEIIGSAIAWGAWAACGYMGWNALPSDEKDDSEGKTVLFFSVLLSPLVGTYFFSRFALYWISSEGRHQRKKARIRREREILLEQWEMESSARLMLSLDEEAEAENFDRRLVASRDRDFEGEMIFRCSSEHGCRMQADGYHGE